MKPPFQKDRKLNLSTLEDWPRKIREDRAAAVEKQVDKCPYCSSKKIVKRGVRKKKLEVVTTDNNGYKGISYERITPVLTGAIQEMNKEIEQMKNENNQLKALDTENQKQIDSLTARIASLEAKIK
mgnify:CR=1 FL=1